MLVGELIHAGSLPCQATRSNPVSVTLPRQDCPFPLSRLLLHQASDDRPNVIRQNSNAPLIRVKPVWLI